jgi:hypothetical protein
MHMNLRTPRRANKGSNLRNAPACDAAHAVLRLLLCRLPDENETC